jgi:hypothetical protein
MNSLEEKTNDWLDAYWPGYPVTGRAAAPAASAGARQHVRAFWLDDGFLSGDAEPLPSMFTSKMRAGDARPGPAKARLAGSISLAARLSKRHISNRTASYIIASFLVLFAAADGFLLATSTFSADRALIEQASAALDEDRTETARLLSVSSPEVAKASKTSSLTLRRAVLPEGESWSAAVTTFKQLVAEGKASTAAAKKQAENERLIERLGSWMNASIQKPATLAQACTAPAHQCWKGKTVVQRKTQPSAPRTTERS